MDLVLRVQSITNATVAEENFRQHLDRLYPITLKLAALFELEDSEFSRFHEMSLASTIFDSPIIGQLPPREAERSFKTYPMLGYIAGIIADTYDRFKKANPEADDEQLLIAAIQHDLDGKVLVGPTTGSFGIGLYVIAKMLAGEKFKLADGRLLNVKALAVIAPEPENPPPGTTHEMPIDKFNRLKQLHVAQDFFGSEPPTYSSRLTRNREAMELAVGLAAQDLGQGIFTPTNPLTMEELQTFVEFLIGNAEQWSEIPDYNQKQLTDLGVELQDDGSILITRPFGDGILGSAMSIAHSVSAYATTHPEQEFNIYFPMSAGPGAVGLQYIVDKLGLENVRITATPDPNNNTWVAYFGKNPVNGHPVINPYASGSTLNTEGLKAPNANGMGSNADAGNPSSLITAKGLESGIFDFEFSTDVMRMLARPIHAADVLAGDTRSRAATYPAVSAEILNNMSLSEKPKLTGLQTAWEDITAADATPQPELASATPLGAMLSQKVESMETDEDIETFARRFAAVIRHSGLTEEGYLRLVTRNEPRENEVTQDAWSELENLADIQGQKSNGDNTIAPFVRALRAAFAIPLETLPKPTRTTDTGKEIIIIQETGFNAPAMFNEEQQEVSLRRALLDAEISQQQRA